MQVRELQRQLQKLRKHHEELEERNEELEALLGEVQNVSKEERLRHEGELEGLQRKVPARILSFCQAVLHGQFHSIVHLVIIINWFSQIKSLEAELRKQDGREKSLTNGEETKHPEPYIQLVKKTLNLITVSS